MIPQSHARLRFDDRPNSGASRLRTGSTMLVSVVALLGVLSQIAGAA